ncbi:MAG: hypothetical protein WCW63_03805, partial [Acholeplasmataceae bacterium]
LILSISFASIYAPCTYWIIDPEQEKQSPVFSQIRMHKDATVFWLTEFNYQDSLSQTQITL